MSRIAVVTGATQGLGLALTVGLAQQLRHTDVVYLTGRDRGRVHAAAEGIAHPRAEVRGVVLDVCDGAAVQAFADGIKARHGGVDIVFSNAAARLTPQTPSAELVVPFVETNNLGTTRVLTAFGAILRQSGRLLVVASSLGSRRQLAEHLRGRFETDTMTLGDVDATMRAWRDAVLNGDAAHQGWPEWINIPSKVGQVAAVRVLARERRATDSEHGTLVAAVCPGLIDTAASRPWFADMDAAQTAEQAAVALLHLALDPVVDPAFYGELVQFGRVIPWS